MFNPHTGIKFEVFAIICNEDMKGNAKCKNSRFEPPFWGLRDYAQGSSKYTNFFIKYNGSTKTAKPRITQTTPYDSPGTLVLWC